jgi:Skp family chaperone for outer membrane proteins
MPPTTLPRLLLVAWALALAVPPRPAAAEDAGPTRIAIVNLGEVFRNYEKAKKSQKELETFFAPYRSTTEKLRDEATKLQQVANDPKADAEAKNAATQKALQTRRKLEDLDFEVRQLLGKKQEQSYLELYADVRGTIEKYADDNKIDLVLIYDEPVKKEDSSTFANVSRKMQAINQGAVVPIFIRPRIDITKAVLSRLNEAYALKK